MTATRPSRRTFLHSSAAALGATVLAPAAWAAPEAAPLDIDDEVQTFLDDWIVESSTGLARTLHQPKKHGLIQNEDGSPWDRGDVYHGNIVARDNRGRFHMTYRYMWSDPGVRALATNIGDDKAHWFRECVAYATSDDGIRWHKPQLGLFEGPSRFKSQKEFPFLVPAATSKANNLGCPFDFIVDLNAHGNISDPQKRFLLRVVRRDDTHPFAEAIDPKMYYSADWPDFAADPHWREKLTLIPGANLSPRGFRTLFGYDHQAREWFATSQDHLHQWMPRGGRDVARSWSPDLVSWHGPKLVLPVAVDEPREKLDWVEYMDLLGHRLGGPTSGLWLGHLCVFHSDRSSDQYMMPVIKGEVWRKGLTETRLVMSRDAGNSWKPVAGNQAWLPYHNEPHGFDRLVFSRPGVRIGDEQWFYYSAWDGDHLTFNRDGSLLEAGFMRTGRTARATLRLDGYLSLTAAGYGSVVTKTMWITGGKLTVNFNPRGGTLRAELQDSSGKPIDGFRLTDCELVRSDGVATPVRWKRSPNLQTLAGKPVRIRFEFAGGDLYSFRFAT